jgi:hypothetical protein
VRRALAAILLAAFCGCSFFMKGVKDDWKPEADPECQPYIIVPIIDAVVGAAALTWAGTTACDEVGSCILGVAPGAALATSAVIGYFKVTKCKAAQKKFRASSPEGQSTTPQ